MDLLVYLLYPFALLLPADGSRAGSAMRAIAPESAWQLRIEQRMTIRITPRGAAPAMPGPPPEMPIETGERFIERRIGNCLPAASIVGVQPQEGNRLLLFMRNGALVAADLDRACRARDFYSGFYLGNLADGNLCVARDKLLARSGANCRLTRIRQLVADRR